jgi:hypothetical protein
LDIKKNINPTRQRIGSGCLPKIVICSTNHYVACSHFCAMLASFTFCIVSLNFRLQGRRKKTVIRCYIEIFNLLIQITVVELKLRTYIVMILLHVIESMQNNELAKRKKYLFIINRYKTKLDCSSLLLY